MVPQAGHERGQPPLACRIRTGKCQLVPNGRAKRVFDACDTNKDGFLDLAEFTNRPAEAWFDSLDEDGDGKLSLAEFTSQCASEQDRKRESDIFKICDRDGDGKLSLEEVKNRPPRANFRKLDTDGDGFLRFEEFSAAELNGLPAARARRIFKLIDRNGDGKLSFEELSNRPAETWLLKMDQDGDERLSLADSKRTPVPDRRRPQQAGVRGLRPQWGRLLGHGGVRQPAPRGCVYHAGRDGDGKFQPYRVRRRNGQPGRYGGEAKKLFQQKDKDHDGFLSLWEYLYDPADARFWALDRDGDGYVSLDAFLAAGRETGKRSPAEERQGKLPAGRTREAFAAMDLNHDGKLSLTNSVPR